MKLYLSFILTLVFVGVTTIKGQEVWSLERCIKYAQDNNISVRQNEVRIKSAELQLQSSKSQRLPSVNGSASLNRSFGRTVDPTTNQFRSQTITSNGFSINASITLFNGNSINNNIKQDKLDLQAAGFDAQANKNNIGLQITNAYLQILLTQEQLENAQKQLDIVQEQLRQSRRLIRAGSLPPNDSLDIVAQVAQQEQTIVSFTNALSINYLNLRQLMELPSDVALQIEEPEISVPTDVDPRLFNEEEIFETAVSILPDIQASESRIKSSELGINLAKAGFLPTLSLGGNLNTNYSNRGITIAGFEEVTQTSNLIINGEPSTITTTSIEPIINTAPYFDQLNENLGQAVGLSLNIPIFNRNRNIVNLEQARLGVIQAELDNKQVKQTIRTNIQTAVADARASQRTLVASERALQAAQVAFDNAQRRFELGAINNLELTTARNTLEQSQIELTRSKYQYFFNLKVVDFYLGRPLKLN